MFPMLSGNPYWSPPEAESARTNRVMGFIKNHLDKASLKKVLFMVIKWNDNPVVYEYDVLQPQEVRTFWIGFNKEERERHLLMGNTSLRSQLNPTEEALFGCDLKIIEGNRYLLTMNQPQLKSRICEIVLDANSEPALIGQINGTLCRIEHAYVQMKKGIVPDVDYIKVYGKSISEGTLLVEKILAQ